MVNKQDNYLKIRQKAKIEAWVISCSLIADNNETSIVLKTFFDQSCIVSRLLKLVIYFYFFRWKKTSIITL